MQYFDLGPFQPSAMSFSHDGHKLAVWGSTRLDILDTITEKTITLYSETVSGWGMPDVGYTTDNQCVVYFRNRKIEVRNLTTFELEREVELHHSTLHLGPGGRLCYLVDDLPMRQMHVVPWDPLTGERMPGVVKHVGSLSQLAVPPDECWIAGSSGTEVLVWNVNGGMQSNQSSRFSELGETGQSIYCLSFSSDGAYLAASGERVRILEVETGEIQDVSRNVHRGRHIAFSPTCPLLAFSGGSREVGLWDAEKKMESQRFAWDIGVITAIAFSPDDNRCAAASDGKVVIWDVD